MTALDADSAQGAAVRLDKLRGRGAWFAFASPALMLASVIYLIVILGSVRLTSNAAPPPWFLWALGVAVILIAVAVLRALFGGPLVVLWSRWIWNGSNTRSPIRS